MTSESQGDRKPVDKKIKARGMGVVLQAVRTMIDSGQINQFRFRAYVSEAAQSLNGVRNAEGTDQWKERLEIAEQVAAFAEKVVTPKRKRRAL